MEGKKNIPVITIIKDGPLKVSGDFTLLKENRFPVESGSEVWLCRCGKSSRKPFCDGSHKK
ncbi:MAG TPA: CDGSH iron-sulfur domain-containing protein [Bacteroidales bacterium]|nr:CDGSH iron-sulfur domain-containing protein [Bacteroidales bacterium]